MKTTKIQHIFLNELFFLFLLLIADSILAFDLKISIERLDFLIADYQVFKYNLF